MPRRLTRLVPPVADRTGDRRPVAACTDPSQLPRSDRRRPRRAGRPPAVGATARDRLACLAQHGRRRTVRAAGRRVAGASRRCRNVRDLERRTLATNGSRTAAAERVRPRCARATVAMESRRHGRPCARRVAEAASLHRRASGRRAVSARAVAQADRATPAHEREIARRLPPVARPAGTPGSDRTPSGSLAGARLRTGPDPRAEQHDAGSRPDRARAARSGTSACGSRIRRFRTFVPRLHSRGPGSFRCRSTRRVSMSLPASRVRRLQRSPT